MNDEEESLHRYGTPLDPLDEDEVLTRKPITIEDQIVTDENGKRRFHGAFTGGFSAGFWNTVGSLEGWKPASFKSSRLEKAPQHSQQKPEDFMDDEDLGEFGIAPQRIAVKTDYQIDSKNRKRKFMQTALVTSGPIPGEPALATLLQPMIKDKIAVSILKSMGWKPGQGIGPRLTAKEKKKARNRNKREEYILQKYADYNEDEIYSNKHDNGASDGSDVGDDDDDDEITFAPDDYEPLICRVKTERFGLGYISLRGEAPSEESIKKPQQHFQLFGPLEVLDKQNKKVSITGQAFGVGALEEEDEDIYARDDITKYDFSLEAGKQKKKQENHVQDKHVVKGFVAAQDPVQFQRPYLIELPSGFQPRNWAMRRSRFAPLAPEKLHELENMLAHKKRGLGRHDLNPDQRSDILEDKTIETTKIPTTKFCMEDLRTQQRTRNERTKALLERITSKSDNFTRGGIINTEGEEISKEVETMKNEVKEEQKNLLAKANKKTKDLNCTATEFKPFLNDEAKQRRYEKFLEANLRDEAEISSFLATIQPVELPEWDREMEKQEFMQAKKIYKPLGGIMSERFVSETKLDTEKSKTPTSNNQESHETKKITMERTKEMWKPHALLCKRYNIAEPFVVAMDNAEMRSAKKPKLSIFDYLETSVNTKANFHTPVIIPKNIEKPKLLIDNQGTNELFNKTQQKPLAMETHNNVTTKEPALAQTKETTALKTFKTAPKTELEKRVEESRDKPASEKVELFRAIFEDSDDDVDGNNDNDDKKTQLDIEKLELPTTSRIKTAAEENILRNTSPPRGIFAAFFNTKNIAKSNAMDSSINPSEKCTEDQKKLELEIPTKITFKSRIERERSVVENDMPDAYGPILPQNLKPTEIKEVTEHKNELLTLKVQQKKSIEAGWVERTVSTSDSESSSNGSNTDSIDSSVSKVVKKRSKKLKKKATKNFDKKKSKKNSKKKSKSKKKSEHDVKKTKKKKKKNK